MLKRIGIWAIVFFTLINLGSFISAQVYGREKNKICNYVISTFENTKQQPSVVLLGSSLMRMPFYLSDNEHSYYLPKYDQYCWNQTLQNMLNNGSPETNVVFDLAIDGGMVSDTFLISKKLLRGPKTPKWIVYGIAPRDLLDNFLSSETRTPVFDRLYGLGDMWEKKSTFPVSFNEKLKIVIERLCYLYGDRGRIHTSLKDAYIRLREGRLFNDFNKPATDKKQLDSTALQELASSKNIGYYQKRFKVFQPEKFNKQKSFLKALCEDARKKGINVLLINMPLTPEITNLIPKEGYFAYNQALTEMTKFPHVRLLNLSNSGDFPNSYFCDLVHLNGLGGHFLNMLITKSILKDNISEQIMKQSNPQDSIQDGLACWWLTKSYFAKPHPPDIVILGGSQLGALLGADTYVYQKAADITGDHRSKVLEHDLTMLLNKNFKVFIGCLPGALLSDQLASSHILFSKHFKPQLVALTFSAKDFLGANVSYVMDTEPYLFFSTVRAVLGSQNNENIAKSINKLLEQNSLRKKISTSSQNQEIICRSPLNLSNPFQRFCPGEVVISTNDGYSFFDNIEEYKRIYKDPLNKKLGFQLNRLQELLSYLAKEHIKVVAFNLPLTEQNRNLLPETFWSIYNNQIASICRSNGADFVNLDLDWRAFENKDFVDTAHLNLPGGLKLTRPLALFIANKFHEVDFAELRRREYKMF